MRPFSLAPLRWVAPKNGQPMIAYDPTFLLQNFFVWWKWGYLQNSELNNVKKNRISNNLYLLTKLQDFVKFFSLHGHLSLCNDALGGLAIKGAILYNWGLAIKVAILYNWNDVMLFCPSY